MKTTLFFSFAFLLSASVFSQDVLNIKDGSSINGKVIEINESQVKYKDQLNPDGPVYVLDKDKISSIHYKNGTDEIFSAGSSLAASNSSLTNVVNGYNTDPNSSPSNYANIPVSATAQPVDNSNYPVNSGNKTLANAAALGIFALLSLNSWSRSRGHSSMNWRKH